MNERMDRNPTIVDMEKTLELLREIESNPQVTQRDISKKFGLSLGKVNFLIKSLISKGVIKVRNFKNSKNKKAYLYMLTPKGTEERLRLTYNFFIRKQREYEKLKDEIELFQRDVNTIFEKSDAGVE